MPLQPTIASNLSASSSSFFLNQPIFSTAPRLPLPHFAAMAAQSLAFAAAIHPPLPARSPAAPPRAPLRLPPRIHLPSPGCGTPPPVPLAMAARHRAGLRATHLRARHAGLMVLLPTLCAASVALTLPCGTEDSAAEFNGREKSGHLAPMPTRWASSQRRLCTVAPVRSATGASRRPGVRTAQFDTILNEPPVIIIQMRVNTCWPESVPRVIPHLETRITDTSSV